MNVTLTSEKYKFVFSFFLPGHSQVETVIFLNFFEPSQVEPDLADKQKNEQRQFQDYLETDYDEIKSKFSGSMRHFLFLFQLHCSQT